MDISAVWKKIPRWLAPVAIVLGLVCIVVGFGLLTWAPGVEARIATPTFDATDAASVAPLPTLALMVTSAPTPAPSPAVLRPILPVKAGAVFTLTILHSNDTWGYTRPCG
jgi:hypothetical protein